MIAHLLIFFTDRPGAANITKQIVSKILKQSYFINYNKKTSNFKHFFAKRTNCKKKQKNKNDNKKIGLVYNK